MAFRLMEIFILLFTLTQVLSYDNLLHNCDFDVDAAQYNGMFLSPHYLPPGKSCKWNLHSPPGSNVALQCNISLQNTADCAGDHFGIIDPPKVKTYCGVGSLEHISENNGISVFVNSNSYYGRGSLIDCQFNTVGPSRGTDKCRCGKRNRKRIVGGVVAGVNEFPMLVAMVTSHSLSAHCGSTIINRRTVLTASHCLHNQHPSRFLLLVGGHNTRKGRGKLYSIERFIMHPEYNHEHLLNDVALIRSTEPFIYTAHVSPACLPFQYTDVSFAGQQIDLVGWGSSGMHEDTKLVPYKARQVVSDSSICSGYTNDPMLPSQLCIVGVSTAACKGDSGGPVLWTNENHRLVIIGLVSFGNCEVGRNAGMTRITYFLDWIMSNLAEPVCQ